MRGRHADTYRDREVRAADPCGHTCHRPQPEPFGAAPVQAHRCSAAAPAHLMAGGPLGRRTLHLQPHTDARSAQGVQRFRAGGWAAGWATYLANRSKLHRLQSGPEVGVALQQSAPVRAVAAALNARAWLSNKRFNHPTWATGQGAGTLGGRRAALQQSQHRCELVPFTAHELFSVEIETSQPRQIIELERGQGSIQVFMSASGKGGAATSPKIRDS